MMNVPGGAASVTLVSGRLDRYMTRPAATKGPYGTGRVIAGVFVLIFSCLIVLVVAGSVLAIGQDPSPTMQVLRIGLPLSLWWLVVWAIAKVMFSMSLADILSWRPGLRWGLLGRSVAVAGVIFAAYWGYKIAQSDKPVVTSSAVMIALLLALVMISLQASAEELVFRGFGPQIVLGKTGFSPAVFWVVSAGFSVLFALLHGASNAAMFGFYVVMALILAALVWRTAGLEAAFALHLVFNLTSQGSGLLLGQDLTKESATPTATELLTLIALSVVAAVAMAVVARGADAKGTISGP